jgi:murein DD-endopeptidase MepM/ murein hydrolase activator NlpD
MACGGDADSAPSSDQDGVVITPLDTPTTSDTAPGTATPPVADTPAPSEDATPVPTAESNSRLTGFIYPIAGGCLPIGDQLMPNAPREYRSGTHEGVDFYGVDNCTAITIGTPVMAAKAGTVIRADLDYVSPTTQQMNAYLADPTSDTSFDAFRGRQVWIDHGDGIVTRYCHLNAVADGLAPGSVVNAGDVIAHVGETGTPESVNNPGTQYHLHFEVRVADSYLGAGLPPQEVRGLYLELFGQ